MHTLKYMFYRFKWWVAQYVTLPVPVHVDIEVSSICNLKCSFCPQSEKEHDFELKFMNYDLFKNVVDELVELGVPSIKLNLRGESTIHPMFTDMLLYVKGKFVDIRLNTNGNYKPALNPYIRETCTEVIYSVDSWCCGEYAEIRKGGRLSTVYDNICQVYGRTKVTLSFVLVPDKEASQKDSISLALLDFPDANIFARPAMDRTGNDFIRGSSTAVGRKNCHMPDRRLAIASNGDVYPCCVMWHHPFIILGNVLDDSIRSIWRGTFIEIIRMHLEVMEKGKHHIAPMSCQNCESSESYLWD